MAKRSVNGEEIEDVHLRWEETAYKYKRDVRPQHPIREESKVQWVSIYNVVKVNSNFLIAAG